MLAARLGPTRDPPMQDSNALPDHVHAEITRLCADGDEQFESGLLQAALDKYDEALALLPADKMQWEASTWIFAAKGDAFFTSRQWHAALQNFQSAVACPGGIGNPFLHLRLGECCLELGNEMRAADELTRAYALEGEELIAAENPKYLAFLKTRIQTDAKPRKSWWPFSRRSPVQ